MIELGRTRPRYTKIWNPKSGLDFYPFHRWESGWSFVEKIYIGH
jgi:hypothetical protein